MSYLQERHYYFVKNFLLIISLVFYSMISLAQEIEFYGIDGNKIEKIEFEEKLDQRFNLALSFQKGSKIETRLVSRIQTGKLSMDTRQEIITNLQEVSGIGVGNDKMLIINYIQHDINNSALQNLSEELMNRLKTYYKKYQRLRNSSLFFVYTKNTSLQINESISWHPDKNLLIGNTFLKFKYPYGSFFIIKPNGEYYAWFGEYSYDQVIRQAKLFNR